MTATGPPHVYVNTVDYVDAITSNHTGVMVPLRTDAITDQVFKDSRESEHARVRERLETIVKRWRVKKSFFLQRGGLSNNILVMFGFALVKHDRQTPLKYGFIKPAWAASM